MTESLSRRDLISQSIPAIAAGSVLLGAGTVFGQEKPASAAPGSRVAQMLRDGFKDGQYQLPKLPYDYNALEPHIDAQTMELHHSKHHQAYVTNLNNATKQLKEESANPTALAREISFNAGGHVLHTIFFGTLGAPSKTTLDPKVKIDLAEQYGSFEKFQAYFTKVAAGVKGSGWAVAYHCPISDKILVTETGDQDQRLIPGATPILLIDVWEHAYYLKHQNKRADYIKAWWNVVDWSQVDAFYNEVRAAHGKA